MTWRSLVHYLLLYQVDSSERTIAILGDRRWLQAAKQGGDKTSKTFLCTRNVWKQCNERPTVGGVSGRRRNGAPSRKECMTNCQMTKASNE